MSNIALQIERSSSGSVAVGSNVIFDSIVYAAGNISYNNLTGIITFNENGNYIINWWVATQSSSSANGVVFALSSSAGDYLKGNSPIKTGEVVGVGIINVTSAPVTVSLVNANTGIFFYPLTVPLTATLVVAQAGSSESGTTFITGIGAPDCSIGNLGNVYVDLSNGNLYYKTEEPTSPVTRSIPAVTGTIHTVGSGQAPPYDTIQNAIDAASTVNGDGLFLEDALYTITTTLTVTKSLTIQGNGPAFTTIEKLVSTGGTTMINVNVSNVIFKDLKIVQNYPSTLSTETALAFTNSSATGIYVNNCEIFPCEFGIGMNAAEFQITDCSFTYAPLGSANNSYRYIAIYNTTGVSIISQNTFVADSGNSRCYFVAITNISGSIEGQLIVSNNTQLASAFSLRHLFQMEQFLGANFQLFLNNNTTINEGNVPVLLYGADLSIFDFIQINGNNMQNDVGKGLIGIDLYYTGSTEIFAISNTVANPNFTPPWESATIPASIIVGYNTSAIPTNPQLPISTCYWLPLG